MDDYYNGVDQAIATAEAIFAELDLAMNPAEELFEGDRARASAWMITANPVFFNDYPRQWILRGDGSPVIHWLKQRLGRTPGAAF